MNCYTCAKPLTGGVDTFGEIGQEMCWECHSMFLELERQMDEAEEFTWYGLAPHHHDLTITGTYIRSTVFDPLPATRNENGEYEIRPRLFFWPDGEVDGMAGIWREVKG